MIFMTISVLMRGLIGLLVLGSSAAIAGDEYRRDSGERYVTQSEPLPWRGSTKDDGYPIPQGPSESYAPPPAPRRAVACVSTVGMRDALNGQGWHAFSDVDYRGPIAYMSARSDRGRRFDLQVDSCSGEVIEAHPAVVYADPPRVYYDERPAVGVYIGGGHRFRGHHGGHRYYRGHGRW
jgi:hypothetical protein